MKLSCYGTKLVYCWHYYVIISWLQNLDNAQGIEAFSFMSNRVGLIERSTFLAVWPHILFLRCKLWQQIQQTIRNEYCSVLWVTSHWWCSWHSYQLSLAIESNAGPFRCVLCQCDTDIYKMMTSFQNFQKFKLLNA